MKAQAGHFYAVGIGPGAPDLLTVRAVDLIKSADLIIAPRAQSADSSLALRAIGPYLTMRQEVVEHVYPMKRDIEATLACWREVAVRVQAAITGKKSVVQVTLGDPLIYSTSAYLLECLEGMLPPERVHIVPGISSFQATAARLGRLLCSQEDRVLIMPATDIAAVERALDECETLVLFKAGKHMDAIRALLARRKLLSAASAGFYVEQEQEALWRDMSEDFPCGDRYMTIVIVRTGRKSW